MDVCGCVSQGAWQIVAVLVCGLWFRCWVIFTVGMRWGGQMEPSLVEWCNMLFRGGRGPECCMGIGMCV